MIRIRWLCATLMMVMLASPDPCWAAGNKDKAKKLFQAGKAHYAAGEYNEAAARFIEGYELDPVPAFLLNAAQSFRSAEDHAKALEYYQKYLQAAPDTSLREQVEELIKELKQKTRPSKVITPPPRPEPPPEPPPPQRPQPTPIYKQWWLWTAVAVVVVGTSIGVGAYYGTREPDYVKEGGLGSVRW
jgi:tetratricopeptide (TPR) repeat protein